MTFQPKICNLNLIMSTQKTNPNRKMPQHNWPIFLWKNLPKKGWEPIYLLAAVAAAAKSLQSCPTLCDPIDSGPPGSPVLGILQARTLEWVAISFSNAWKWKVKVSHSVVSDSSDPMHCSPPGSSVHGIFQARVLEWGAIAFSKVWGQFMWNRWVL